jgi:tetratricopeptide (TPR) repeat protein
MDDQCVTGTGRRPDATATIRAAILVVAVTAIVYWQVRGFGFIEFDDPDYVTENPHVLAGLRWTGLEWALHDTSTGNWVPVAWLSHMADVTLFGLSSGDHHLTSAAIHLLSTIVLLVTLARSTRQLWPSTFVAFMFALHPLHAESVAWIAERRDVLSGFFGVLGLWTYLRYSERPGPVRYTVTMLTFALGLCCKPMLVTVPLLLLLFDWWPLGRLDGSVPSSTRPAIGPRIGWRRAVLEKVPLVILSASVSVVTYAAQSAAGAVGLELSAGARLANALAGYGAYLSSTFWPSGLSVFYPLPREAPTCAASVSVAIVAGVSLVAVLWRRQRPYLLVGWFWFLGMLVPVIGLVQAGAQARADRYMYLPLVGLAIIVGWGATELSRCLRHIRVWLAAASVAACAACAMVTWHQLRFWHSTVALFEHAIATTTDNAVAHNALGFAQRDLGHLDRALAHFQEAVRIWPRFAEARTNLGEALIASGRPAEAVPHLMAALELRPGSADAAVNLANSLSGAGRYADAAAAYRVAIRIAPDRPAIQLSLASALAHQGLVEESALEVDRALARGPVDAALLTRAGSVLVMIHRVDRAADEFVAAIDLAPNFVPAHLGLGNVRVSQGRLEEAVTEFTQAARLAPDNPRAHANLGAALASLGKFDAAIAAFLEALRLDPNLVEVRQNLSAARALQTHRES